MNVHIFFLLNYLHMLIIGRSHFKLYKTVGTVNLKIIDSNYSWTKAGALVKNVIIMLVPTENHGKI